MPGVGGFGQRGAGAWHTIYTGFASQLWSCGGSDFHPDGSSAIASDTATEAARTLLDAVRAAGPENWTGQGWYELAMDFAHGKYGLLVDSDHYIAYFENPQLSSVAGDARYALPPAGPAGLRRPNMWMWSMVMNARSDRPDAPAVNYIEVARRWTRALRDAYRGEGSLEQCLGAAAGDIDRLVIRA